MKEKFRQVEYTTSYNLISALNQLNYNNKEIKLLTKTTTTNNNNVVKWRIPEKTIINKEIIFDFIKK